MSQSAAVRAARPAARPAARGVPTRPSGRSAPLRVVGTPDQARSRAGLVIGCLTLLGLGLVGLLLLNVSLDKGAFVLRQQQADTNRLLAQRQALQEQLAALQAPQTLEERARKLGMVNAPNVAFVRSSDGKVLGVSKRAVADPRRSVSSGGQVQRSATTGGTSSINPTTSPTGVPTTTPTAPVVSGASHPVAVKPPESMKVTVTGRPAAKTTSTTQSARSGKGAAAKRTAPASRKRVVTKPVATKPIPTKP